MTDVGPRRSMELLDPVVDSLDRDIAALTPEQWQTASSCAGWQVADLVAHVVRNGWSLLTFTERALSGDPTPAFGPAVAHIQEEIKLGGAQAAAERQAREHGDYAGLIGRLTTGEFDKTAVHPSGARSIAWGCTQRLAEAVFHQWDLRSSLGQHGPLDASVAGYLLAFLMDPAQSPVLRKPAEDVAPSSVCLISGGDGERWLISVGPNGRRIEPGAQGEHQVTAPAGWLALALYGRAKLTDPPFTLSPGAAQAFAACLA